MLEVNGTSPSAKGRPMKRSHEEWINHELMVLLEMEMHCWNGKAFSQKDFPFVASSRNKSFSSVLRSLLLIIKNNQLYQEWWISLQNPKTLFQFRNAKLKKRKWTKYPTLVWSNFFQAFHVWYKFIPNNGRVRLRSTTSLKISETIMYKEKSRMEK